MIERHTEYGPIVIDFDFKFTAYDTRLFTSEIVADILNAYIIEIKTIWEIKDDTDLNAYVFTRPAPYYSKSGENNIKPWITYHVSTYCIKACRTILFKEEGFILDGRYFKNITTHQ